MSTPPRWDLSNVFPDLESKEYEAAVAQVTSRLDDLEEYFTQQAAKADPSTPAGKLAKLAGGLLDRFNVIGEQAETIYYYIYSFTSTDSRNQTAMKKMSEFEQLEVRYRNLGTRFRAWVGKIAPALDEVIPLNETTRAHAFTLKEAAAQSRYLMSEAEETLAAELSLAGANAWSKLQGTVTSQGTVDFELDGETRKLPMPALLNLYSHPEESVRRRVYEAEMAAWETVREPLAACMNGVKAEANSLDRRRGRTDALHSAIDKARIDRPTLEAMLAAMQASLPAFRKYFRAKAKRLGKEKLPWWDLFAPTGESSAAYDWDSARTFIVENFGRFAPELAAFAERAYDNRWIDAEQRDGKRAGAFCMGLPAVRESRVLCNFDSTLDQVSTIAHELGHAFHNECAYQAGKTYLQQDTPMTMAETASIMCETVVMQAVLKETRDPREELAILENMLINDSQVIVDIYSRYLFEQEVFERRAKSELSPDDLCDAMARAQAAAYGDGLDEKYRHKYMWTWKPHYYMTNLSFYNFPYAFGLLFGIGLFAIYQQRGADFVPDYKNLLASTGEASAADLAARFGIDVRSLRFWEDSLAVIARRIERYCEI